MTEIDRIKDILDDYFEGYCVDRDDLRNAILTCSSALEELVDIIHDLSEDIKLNRGLRKNQIIKQLINVSASYDAALYSRPVQNDFENILQKSQP